jgi:3-phenylpropionate/trans-cinnamate dioxygenase ferredoxin subunit
MPAETSITLALGDIPEGGMHACMVGSRDILVCRTKDRIYALDNICTHAYARLHEGRLRGTRLICPLHGAAFDIRDGRVLGAPATRPLATHTVKVVGDSVELSITTADSAPLRL